MQNYPYILKKLFNANSIGHCSRVIGRLLYSKHMQACERHQTNTNSFVLDSLRANDAKSESSLFSLILL